MLCYFSLLGAFYVAKHAGEGEIAVTKVGCGGGGGEGRVQGTLNHLSRLECRVPYLEVYMAIGHLQ